jgi:isopenicillin-N epimerase
MNSPSPQPPASSPASNSPNPAPRAPRPSSRRIDVDSDWSDVRADWDFRPEVSYLNHGSFGPSPQSVRDVQAEWQRRLTSNPMDFYVREYEAAYGAARDKLAVFIGTTAKNLALVENATYGMNVVANGFPLAEGDEVLFTDHEYGAVLRVWRRICEPIGAKITTATLPFPFVEGKAGIDAILDAIDRAITPRTKLFVFSHITSPTAVIFPAADLCQLARDRGVRVCIDGPHAVATLPLALDALGCDYYTASCHKWLCAPFGSGFLYVHPQHHAEIKPPVLSWGRIQPAVPTCWTDELMWQGTRDPSPYLSVPAAIDYLDAIGFETYRERTHHLARYARERIEAFTGLPAYVPDDPTWYGSMIGFPLAPGDSRALQQRLRAEFGIETPVIDWNGRRFIRVSCHLYTTTEQIDHLAVSLAKCLQNEV